MKVTFAFCLTLILCSCFSGRIKKVPVAKQLVEVEHVHDAVEHNKQWDRTPNLAEAKSESMPEVAFDNPEIAEVLLESVELDDNPDDEPSEVEKVRVAIETEHLAKKSLNEGISSLVLSILSVILPFILLASLICFILGIVHYNRANKARFSTPKAERKLKNAKGLLIASGVIIGLFVLAIIVVLSLILL